MEVIMEVNMVDMIIITTMDIIIMETIMGTIIMDINTIIMDGKIIVNYLFIQIKFIFNLINIIFKIY